jgi:non-ribosomal peptide synthetase component E (peptide arylation enzyme)
VGGDGVARGYLGQPALTAERFVPDPFGPPGGRLYRTGDLARHRADGTLEYLGRRDHQVKLHGHRIELGEIEGAIVDHPEVRQAAVIVQTQDRGTPQLVAYVATDRPEPAGWLGPWLRERLPDYMCPSAVIGLPELPLTANGKVDRERLTGTAPPPDYVPPRTAVEQALADIWCEVLGIERVGSSDNFFEVGGDSISAMQVAARVQRMLRVRLALPAIFQAATLADLAAAVVAQELEPGRTEAAAAVVNATRLMSTEELAARLSAVHPEGAAGAQQA